MERCGGFDEYIMRTPPEELRSLFGEKMRKLLYFYMKHPEYREWHLPARLMSKGWAQVRRLNLMRRKGKYSSRILTPKCSKDLEMVVTARWNL